MAAQSRKVRSYGQRSTTSRTSTRRDVSRPAVRPQLSVVTRERSRQFQTGEGMASQALKWAQTRRAPYLYMVTSIAILAMSLCGSLILRTAMVENAFSISQTQTSVSRLVQDVQQDRTKLDELEASLPQRAQELGMRQGGESLTIDLGNAQ